MRTLMLLVQIFHAPNGDHGVMDRSTALERLTASRVARLATVGRSGPHLVPIVFAVVGDEIVSPVDDKPKRTRDLRRLANIAEHSRVSILADEYSDDWTRLWWVRVDGNATVVARPKKDVIDALVAKYDQYRQQEPGGPFILVAIDTVRGWSATPID